LGLAACGVMWGSLSGCQKEPPLQTLDSNVAPAVEMPSTATVIPMKAAEKTSGGNAVVLADVDGKRLAFIGDRDAAAVRVVDPEDHRVIANVPVRGKPWQLTVAKGRLFAALRDTNEIVTITAHEDGHFGVLSRTRMDSTGPVGLATTPDASRLLVTSGWGQRLTGLALPSMEKVFSVALDREPRSVAVTPDGKRAFVTHAIGGHLSEVDLTAANDAAEPRLLAYRGTDSTPPPRRPIRCCFGINDHLGADEPFGKEGVGFSPAIAMDRRPALVTKPAGGVPRDGTQGFALVITERQVIAPAALVHTRPGGTRGSGVYGSGGGIRGAFPGAEPALVTVPIVPPEDPQEEGALDPLHVRVMTRAFAPGLQRQGFSGFRARESCLLPRSAAHDPVTETVLVSCLGSNEVVVHTEHDAGLAFTTPRRWKVGAGPVGVAVDSERRIALVWSQFDRTLSTLDLTELGEGPVEKSKRLSYPKERQLAAKTTALPPVLGDENHEPLSPLAERGRRLFHATEDRRITGDGRACVSCHPDGRDDGLTWPTPKGPRQTPMLAGKLDEMTAPFGWQGSAATVPEHLAQTFKRLGGTGLEGEDLEALLAYLQEMGTPKLAAQPDETLVTRGKALFDDVAVGCGTCHTKGGGSDGLNHQIEGSPMLETPSLRFVGGTGPYWHDGRYATLTELLKDTKGKMGWGRELTDDDLGAIEAYLHTL